MRSEDNRKRKWEQQSRTLEQNGLQVAQRGHPQQGPGRSLPSRVPWRWVTGECSGSPGFQSIFSAWTSLPAPSLLLPQPCPLLPSRPRHLFPRWRRKFTSEPISCVSCSEKTSLLIPDMLTVIHGGENWLLTNSWEQGQDRARELTRPRGLVLPSLLVVRVRHCKACAIKSSHQKEATLELNCEH